ncbi:MAG: hypothetical protein L6406_23900 [Desulfobacterales bacterium]|nr:hypothetical protein [Desulfobacterales bacterium]
MIYHTLKVHYVKWFSEFHKVALAQSRHGGVKQANVKNGERENSEAVSGGMEAASSSISPYPDYGALNQTNDINCLFDKKMTKI